MPKKIDDLHVIGVPWHVAHQYELAKMFFTYDLLENPYRAWGDSSRPRPENMRHIIEFEPKDYDLAILHVDQQCVHERYGKRKLFEQFCEATQGMKRVVINHMTPFDDTFTEVEVVEKLKHLVGDIPMITNSRQAARQWGWGNPIIHGMEVDEWVSRPKEPRIITSLSPGGMSTAYRRELLQEVMMQLEEKGINLKWIMADVKFDTFEEYQDYISRSLIYFNPTWQSPMPRSRTEAMLSGACVVSTRHHDWADYIDDGKNGFIVEDEPRAITKLLVRLIENPNDTLAIGKRGREMARKTFNHENFRKQWTKQLEEIGVL